MELQVYFLWINFFTCVFEAYMLYDFLNGILEWRDSRAWVRMSVLTMLALFNTTVNNFGNSKINIFSSSLLYVLTVFILYKDDVRRKLSYIALLIVIVAIMEAVFELIVRTIPSVQYVENMKSPMGLGLAFVLIKLSTWIVLRIIKLLLRKSEYLLSGWLFKYVLILPIACVVMLWGFFYSGIGIGTITVQKIVLMVGCFLLAFSNAMVFYLFEKMSEFMQEKAEAELQQTRADLKMQHYRRLEEINQEHGRYLHDIKHYMMTIAGLAKQGDTEKILSVLAGMSHTAEQIGHEMYCAHPVMNAILCEYADRAKEFGIRLDIYVEPNSNLNFVSDTDLIVMAGNLLDNAFEAAEGCQGRIRVNVFASPNGKFTVIKVENSFSSLPKKRGELYVTSKTDRERHGMGITNTKQLAERYGGFLHMEVMGELFTASLNLAPLFF